MLKIAYQLGVQAALEESGLTKEAQGKSGLLRRAWQAMTKTPTRKALTAGGALGAGGLGTALALSGEEEPSTLQRVGDVAKGLTSPEMMIGLTSALAQSPGLQGALGLTPQAGAFPPEPATQATQAMPAGQALFPEEQYYYV